MPASRGRAPPDDAALDLRRARPRVDTDALHRREVEDDAVVARAEAGDVVPAAADGDEEPLLAREPKTRDDVGGAGAANDEGRAAVDHPVPDRARLVVSGVARPDSRAAEYLLELGEIEAGCGERCHTPIMCCGARLRFAWSGHLAQPSHWPDRASLRRLQEAVARGVRSRGSAGRLAQLATDVGNVPVDRVLTEHEACRDLTVAQPCGNEP